MQLNEKPFGFNSLTFVHRVNELFVNKLAKKSGFLVASSTG